MYSDRDRQLHNRDFQLKKLKKLEQFNVESLIEETEHSDTLLAQDRVLTPLVAEQIRKTRQVTSIIWNLLSVKQKAQAQGIATPVTVPKTAPFGGIVLAVIDFLRIPAIYLAAYLFDEKVPISLSKNLRWLYSTVVLGLIITSFVFPPAAFVITFLVLSSALVLRTSLLIRALHIRNSLRQELGLIDQQIVKVKSNLAFLKNEAQELHAQLMQADTAENINYLMNKISMLDEKFIQNKQQLIKLSIGKIQIQKAIKKYDNIHLLNKSVNTSIALLALVGAAVSLFFPPAGLAILAVAALGALTHFVFQSIREAKKMYDKTDGNTEKASHNKTCSTRTIKNQMGHKKQKSNTMDPIAEIDKEDPPKKVILSTPAMHTEVSLNVSVSQDEKPTGPSYTSR